MFLSTAPLTNQSDEDLNDWRLRNQEKYLLDVKFTKKKYMPCREGWDHDHCEFCNAKFSQSLEGCEREGWATKDNYYWVCLACYEEFKYQFNWVKNF